MEKVRSRERRRILMRMAARPFAASALVAALATACAVEALAVPLGYRYVGSRVVSQGRVVLWYWNAEHVEVDRYGVSFVARLYARAPDVNQERSFLAIVRCDSKTYRDAESRGPFEAIDAGEPIEAVWRAGCENGKVINAEQRNARLNGGTGDATPQRAEAAPPKPVIVAEAVPIATKPEPADPRRADSCVRFADSKKSTPAGDATITNTCAYPVEVTLCYKGGARGMFDCPAPARGKHGDSLPPGATHVLPEYRRAVHKGITVVACRGEMGSVFPKLDDAGGKSGCY